MYILRLPSSAWKSILLGAVSVFTLSAVTACGSSFEQRLTEEAKEYTANHCPEKVEDGMYLDSISYDGSANVYTSYFSVEKDAENVLNGNIPLLHQMLLQQLRDNVNYQALKEHHVTFAYLYRSKATGQAFFTTRIEAKEYD